MTLRDGKPCKRCGTSIWYKDGKCKLCKRCNSVKLTKTIDYRASYTGN